MITLVTGGARSGKSTYAEKLVKSFGENICYLATALAFDEGMKQRIIKHRTQRPDHWHTYEAYKDIDAYILKNAGQYDGYLLDCVTLMITNQLLDAPIDYNRVDYQLVDQTEAQIIAQVSALLSVLSKTKDHIVIVTNEIGSGIVPENTMARIFRDIAGRINQQIGKAADRVILVVCGQPLTIKGGGV